MNKIKNATSQVVNKDLLKCRYKLFKLNVVVVLLIYQQIKLVKMNSYSLKQCFELVA